MLSMTKDQMKALFNQAGALQKAGRLHEARAAYQKLLMAQPGHPAIQFQLGQIAARMGNWEDAVASLTKAAQGNPNEPAILTVLAHALIETGDIASATTTYDALIKLNPKAIKPRADKALLLQRAGEFPKAEAEFRKALKLAPKEGELYRTFLATKKLAKGDPLIGSMKRAWADKTVQGRSRSHLGFALAKVMEETGQTDQVFRFLDPANRAMADLHPFDPTAREAEIDALITAFEGFDFAWAPTEPHPDITPIFVSGLPRSGTTLVEQIIASHPDVIGGGEMGHGLRAAYGLLGDPAKGLKRLTDLTLQDLHMLGAQYLEAVAKTTVPQGHVTDKSIQTHLIIGVLKQALPGARFIIVTRDPRDIALSIYKNVFAPGRHRYAYDLTHIAAYIRSYDRMMAFWREAMPDDLVEIAYEDLVADPETKTRELIAAAGLDWHEACLNFHENPRTVKTLSVHQVRQPIYRSSRQAWRRYETELQPFIQAYGIEE
ncbi:tetratricopeptide repeat-containing sulfotransferase family protein [Actibacterium sp. 188UL27-1]|uniref:tetratricopeptide repeat-containing sulfotransferase family protein n=1 Tax=Actibacterium sp. 188UL27-1 TaxID=2786961 RepID=UPI00195E7439|nr:tetratricopeptide repeat-containing sulfotransferase family protein [Actibacterium sp. 188UL27-1]MBM7067157.1 sulfotransferase [Actibacterium sp. 188UL27-1]